MKIMLVVGARPNFMKVGPILCAIRAYNTVRERDSCNALQPILVHTGQHYDANMSEVFFTQLAMPAPDINLEVGSGSHASQTADIMARFEPVVLERRPDIVLVYGDVNSTLASALVCAKLLVPFGHVEAGLRSFDRTMPEEINRLVTDQLADLLFTPSEDGDTNLKREGIGSEKIHRVGNVMIDSLVGFLPAAQAIQNGVPERYVLVTLHRPSNVDEGEKLRGILESLLEIQQRVEVVFPVHPRTRQRIAAFGIDASRLHLMGPLPYIEFLAMQRRAAVVITDSVGIQEETTFLGVPCLTMRSNTERPITVSVGTNLLLGNDLERLKTEVFKVLDGNGKAGGIPPLWDGRAGERVADVLQRL